MSAPTLTKPAGCLVQGVGAICLFVSLGMLVYQKFVGGVALLALSLVLLWWGRQPLLPKE
jgi:4-amino-4-deoxy-L-arabinose transferase-like glycosyltransferase